MNTTAAGVLGVSLIVASLILGLTRPASAPVPGPTAAAENDVGRYRTIRHGNYLLLTDTKTGRTWQRFLSPEASSGFTSWQEERVR